MDKELIKKNWGERFKNLLKNPTRKYKEKRVKQKDLATSIDVTENIITQWKQGQWDIGLTSIYAVVEYFKCNYPDSLPMQRLFPDLVNDEIERAKQKVIDEYDEKIRHNEKVYNRNLNKASLENYEKLDDDYKNLDKKYKKLVAKWNKLIGMVRELRKVGYYAKPEIRKPFSKDLSPETFEYFFNTLM